MIDFLFSEFSLSSFIFNIICSFIASLFFIFSLLLFFKPKIDIVPLIAKHDSPFDNTNEICYAFKIINQSFFGVYDIEAKANYYTIQQGENGITNKIFHKIDLKTHKINFIPRRRVFDKNYGDNCIQFFTYENLSDEIKDNRKYIQFQITAKHSLTGLSNIFTYEFVNIGYVQEGHFASGNHKKVLKY